MKPMTSEHFPSAVQVHFAIENKGAYPHLDSLVPDTLLSQAASRKRQDPTGWNLFDALADPSPLARDLLLALDQNIGALDAAGAIRAPRPLRQRLANGEQLLHTLSELALARHLLENGWQVLLDYPFFEKRDVDIWCKREDAERLVEVVNFGIPQSQRKPTSEDTVPGSGACAASYPAAGDPLVIKVVAKFREKFGLALARGWRGEIWIAVDYAKNHELDIEQFVRDLAFPDWPRGVAQLAVQHCPELRGICLYSHRSESAVPRSVHWQPCA